MTDQNRDHPVRRSPLAWGSLAAAIILVAVVAWNPGRPVELMTASAVTAMTALVAVRSTWPSRVPGGEQATSRFADRNVGWASEVHAIGDCLGTTVPRSAENIRGELTQIRSLVADAVATLDRAFSDLHSDTQAQRDLIETMVSALSGADGTGDQPVATISGFVENTGALMSHFVELAETSSEQNLDMVARFDEMSAHMNDMMAMLDNIRGLADQTKLLSLNATIEAARAGDAGRGFAVVADEVRQLSASSNQVNDEIQDQLEEIQSSMQRTRDIVHQTASRDSDFLVNGRADLEEMTSHLRRLDQMLNERTVEAAQLSDRLGRSTADAIRSLQFEDIVRQVAEHADVQAAQMIDFFHTIPAQLGKADANSIGPARSAIESAAQELVLSVPSGPADQDSVDTGEIDLF